MALSHIPLPYRALFLYLEPLAALGGTLTLILQPAMFLNTMTPHATYAADNYVIYQNLAATYLLFSWFEAVVLRVAGGNLAIWRAVLGGIMLCDVIHLYASWSALEAAAAAGLNGGTNVFWRPELWRWEDWVNLGTLWGQAAVRVAFLAGWGVGKEAKQRTA